MRILQVIHDFLDTNVAGSELYTYYLSREMKNRHDIALFYYRPQHRIVADPVITEERYEDIPTYVVEIGSTLLAERIPYQYTHDTYDRLFLQVLERFKPDVVHFQHVLYYSMNFPRIAKGLGIPVIYTLHDYYLLCPKFHMIRDDNTICAGIDRVTCARCCSVTPKSRIIDVKSRRINLVTCWHILHKRPANVKKLIASVDLFLSPSEFLRQMMIRYGVPKGKIIAAANGMNFDIVTRKVVPKAGDKLVFGYIGSHTVVKGLPVLIEAFNGIPDAELRIYGSGGEQLFGPLVRNEAIRFMGRVGDAEKQSAFEGIDALIVPSILYENAPLTINEAFMFKVPVITSNIGGMAENVADGVNGLHFKVGNAVDLRAKIRYLIDNPSELERLRSNIPEVKSIRKNALEIEDMYMQLHQNSTTMTKG